MDLITTTLKITLGAIIVTIPTYFVLKFVSDGFLELKLKFSRVFLLISISMLMVTIYYLYIE